MKTNLFEIKRTLVIPVVALGVMIGAGWASAQSTTDFESFSLGSVHYQGTGGTTISPGGYTVANPYGSLWTVADEWNFARAYDQEVKDDGTGNKVWRLSNGFTTGGFSDQPYSPSATPAGESTAALYNDRGNNHTAPVSPANPRASAATPSFRGGFKFKSATGAAQTGLFLSVSPAPRQGNFRQGYVGIKDTGTGFDLQFYQALAGGLFPSSPTTIATNLSYNAWHQVEVYVKFNDGLNPDGTGNDLVHVALNGNLIHTGTSWETYVAAATPATSPVAVDSLLFRAGGTAVPANLGKGVYFDDVTADNTPAPASFYPVQNITQVTGYTTIQAAINAANPDDEIQVAAGTYNEDVNIDKAGLTLKGVGAGQSTIVGPLNGPGMTVKISAADVTVDGFTITRAGNNPTDWNNPALNNAGGVHIQTVANATVTNNEISGNRTGIDVNNSSGHTIRNNVIANNRTGMILRNTTDYLTVTENKITGNWTVGIVFLDGSGGSNSPVQSAVYCQFFNNDLRDNWYGQIVDRQTGGSLPAPGANPKNFEKNWLGTTAPWVSTANSTEPGYAAQIPVAFGGTATPPASAQPDILGAASANIDYLPLLASGVDTNVETVTGRGTYGFQGDLGDTISSGLFTNTVITTPQVYDDLLIGSGTKVTVTGTGSSLTVDGELGLAAGATLEVINGTLTINGSTLSGTFTFFNSFGSVDFNDDVTITGSADGLILISDVHVADGAVITVDGTLVIDGCVVDSTGNFDLVVNSGAKFTMARTVFVNGDITVNSADTAIYDNRFETSTITVGAGASAARIYHNLTDNLGWLTGTAQTTVDGWSNVISPAGTHNDLSLDLNITPLLATGRTKDTDGNVFVQPTDAFSAKLDVSKLQTKISALEVLLGYNTGFFTASILNLAADWNVLITGVNDASTMIGKIDGALGLSFTYPDSDGTIADQNIASVNLVGKGVEGETLFFHRVKMTGDAFGGETRLATGGATPAYLAPFTVNSGSAFLDGSKPTVIVDTLVNATQDQYALPVDVLDPTPSTPPAYVVRNDQPLVITFTAKDTGLAGLDAADASNDLALSASNGSMTLNSWTVSASEDTLTGIVTYTATLAVPANAENGPYTVTASVRDRSGNWSDGTALGDFDITYELLATVELAGFVGGPRDVVFVATDLSGAVLKTWPAKTVAFTGSAGSVVLDVVPAATSNISAKTAWNLRSKVTANVIDNGVGTANLTGADLLPGGDLSGDNVVNTLDYSRLRYYWAKNVALVPEAAVADITGDGDVDGGDYNLLKFNFYTVGDPQ